MRATTSIVPILLFQWLCPGLGAAQQNTIDPAANRVFQEAVRLEEGGEFDKALEEYNVVAARFPQSPFAPQAILRRGWLLFNKGDAQGAGQAAEKLIGEYTDSRYAAGGFVLRAEIKARGSRTLKDLEDARTEFRRVPLLFPREVYPLLPSRTEARVWAGEISYLLGEFPMAAAAFVGAIEDEVPSEWTIRAQRGLARVLLAEYDWLAAADVLQQIRLSKNPAGRFDAEVTEEAHRLETLIHRLILRPASGQPSWVSARLISIPGAQLRRPVAVAANDDGSLAIVGQKLEALLWLTPQGKVGVRAPVKDPGRPWWASGELYLAESDRVLWLPRHAYLTFEIPKGDKLEPIKGLAGGQRGIFGQFFLLLGSSEQIVAFDAERKFLLSIIGEKPVDLARDAQGHIYALTGKSHQVTRFSPEGATEKIVVRGSWQNAKALEVDALGRIYVLDGRQKFVQVYDSEGKLLASVGPRLPGGIELRNPQDLAVDESGRLYIADARLPGVVVLE